MSCFIVQPGLIAEAVNGLANLTYASSLDKDPEFCQRKCDAWARLNLAAYNGRYREDGGEPERVRFHFVPIGLPGKIAAAYALACLIYQCSEDPVMDSQEFADMEKDLARLHNDIVSNLAREHKAHWGEPSRKFAMMQIAA